MAFWCWRTVRRENSMRADLRIKGVVNVGGDLVGVGAGQCTGVVLGHRLGDQPGELRHGAVAGQRLVVMVLRPFAVGAVTGSAFIAINLLAGGSIVRKNTQKTKGANTKVVATRQRREANADRKGIAHQETNGGEDIRCGVRRREGVRPILLDRRLWVGTSSIIIASVEADGNNCDAARSHCQQILHY